MRDLSTATIRDLEQDLQSGALTAKELVLGYIARIQEIDWGENGLNSVLELNPDALFLAEDLDRKRKESGPVGPLHGIPILLKDNINTGDKMTTTAGSLALEGNFAPCDAEVARRLRKAGAILLGKANMTEFANYMTAGMPGGYSSRGGQVLCPYNRYLAPGGSSSGSAVSVAAGLCAAAIGTETCGSIMSPARKNGVVGLKPTSGLVSRRGIIPISNMLDTAGPIARSVYDAALLLQVLAGCDPQDPATRPLGEAFQGDYTSGWGRPLAGVRIGLNRHGMELEDEDTRSAITQLEELLRKEGAILVEGADFALTAKPTAIMGYEFKRCLNAYLATTGEKVAVKNLGEIIQFNQAHPRETLRYGQTLLLHCENEATGRLVEREYWEAIAQREEAIQQLDALFDAHRLDILLCCGATNLAPVTGFPSLNLPIGQNSRDNMPIGAYLMARRFAEKTLLQAAAAIEKTFRPQLAFGPIPEGRFEVHNG